LRPAQRKALADSAIHHNKSSADTQLLSRVSRVTGSVMLGVLARVDVTFRFARHSNMRSRESQNLEAPLPSLRQEADSL
jgi:hypothetical protein